MARGADDVQEVEEVARVEANRGEVVVSHSAGDVVASRGVP